MVTLGSIQFSRILDKTFLLISSSIIGLRLLTATFSLLGFGSGNSVPVPKSVGSCSENVLFIIIEICWFAMLGAFFKSLTGYIVVTRERLIWHFGQYFHIFFSSDYLSQWFWFTNMFFNFGYIFFVKIIFEVMLNYPMCLLWISHNLAFVIIYGRIFERLLMQFFDSFKDSVIIVYTFKFM